ncbi:MAG: hypothetical protein AAFM92_09965 [Pseudomonadota bacterium]
MSRRHAHLLRLLHLKTQTELRRCTGAVEALRRQELRTFEKADQLDLLLAEIAQEEASALTPGALASARAMAHALRAQVRATREDLAGIRTERAEREAELARVAQRATSLEEKRAEALRVARRQTADHGDASTAHRGLASHLQEHGDTSSIRRPHP